MSNFSVQHLDVPDVLLVRPRIARDHRGSFMETYSAKSFADLGVGVAFVQDNQSRSILRGTVRGLHFQAPPRAQAKLVQCLNGAIVDVAVDIRRGSATYGKWVATTLTAAAGDQLFVPRGFAHGFCTLEPDTVVAYKVDDSYAPECEGGVLWNDPDLGIPWPVAEPDAVLSGRDGKLPRLRDLASPFTG